jgi:hypothetical protein
LETELDAPLSEGCPYLGLAGARTSARGRPDADHRCYGRKPAAPVDATHQRTYCLADGYVRCRVYVAATQVDAPRETGTPAGRQWTRFLPWIGLALALASIGIIYARDFLRTPGSPAVTAAPAPAVAIVTLTATPSLEQTPAMSPFPSLTPSPVTQVSTPTTVPGGSAVTLAPGPGEAGWWGSGEKMAEHLDDSFLYAGFSKGQAILSAVRFDLRRVRRGTPIMEASVKLAGLNAERFNPAAGGTWTVQLLDPKTLPDLALTDFQTLYNEPAGATLFPTLYPSDMAAGETNSFALDESARAWLEKLILDGTLGVVARIVGPGGGEDTLFAWDSGTGPATKGALPQLVLGLGAPPATPPPLATGQMIVATFTPTPANVLTAAANALAATVMATTVGTYTPVPYQVATPTPVPANLATAQAVRIMVGGHPIVVYTPAPANSATAAAYSAYATAVAMTTGTFTPVPTDAVTPIVVPPTPEPQNAATQVAQLRTATAQAGEFGTPTPLPPGALIATVTPAPPLVTLTPTPANYATAAIQAAEATLAAMTIGTYTPMPRNARMPTATPLATPLPLLVPITPMPAPTLTTTPPASMPGALAGKILFYSDRTGSPKLYALDPATGALSWVTQEWPFTLAQARDRLSPDGSSAAEVQTVTDVTQTNPQTGAPSATQSTAAIFIRNIAYQRTRELTTHDRFSYDPAWSPAADQIAFVARGDNDEIYAISADGSNLRRLTTNTWEWDKHPSWSPNGKQIVFWSNRESGRRQLWIMNADGSNQRPLLASPYNDWDPIWVK